MNTDRPITLEDVLIALAILVVIGLAIALFWPKRHAWVRYEQPASQPKKPRLADDRVPWYLKFVYARGKFSPRLFMAWLDAAYIIRVIEHMMDQKAEVQNGVLVQPFDMLPIVIALVGLLGALLALGTVQTAVLGDLAPAPGAGNAGADALPPDGQP